MSFTSSRNPNQEDLKKLRKQLSKTTKVKHDRFDQLLWISPKKAVTTLTFANTTIETYFFYQQDGTLGPKRFRLKYKASDWLFLEEISFLVGYKNKEQRVYKIDLKDEDVQREVLSGSTIYEKVDIPFTKEIERFYEDILSTTKNEPVAYKLSGKSSYVNTANWTGKFKKMAIPINAAYDYLIAK